MYNKIIILFAILVISMGVVSASESMDVTTSDTFYFYSLDSLAADDGIMLLL